MYNELKLSNGKENRDLIKKVDSREAKGGGNDFFDPTIHK